MSQFYLQGMLCMLIMIPHHIILHNDQLGDWDDDGEQALGHDGMMCDVGYVVHSGHHG